MFFVLLQWMYAFVLFYSAGFLFSKYAKVQTSALEKQLVGLAIVSGILLWVSIFSPISKTVVTILTIIILGLLAPYMKNILQTCKTIKPNIFITIFLFFFAYLSTLGVKSYDAFVYHHQSVMWLNQFGTIVGLGNLDVRFAYVTSWFHTNALFDITQVYALTSYVLFLGFIYFFSGVKGLFAKKFTKLNLYRSFAGLPLVYFLQTIPSLSNDIVSAVLIVFIGELFLRKKPAILVSAMVFYAFSVKFSSILLFLPLLWYYRSELKVNIIWLVVFFIPSIIRSFLISGFLYYPITFIDFFTVKWKIPEFIWRVDKEFISAWAKVPETLMPAYREMAFLDWFSIWISQTQNSILFVLILVLFVIYFKTQNKNLISFAAVVSILVWFIQVPDLRFIIGWFAILAGMLFCSLHHNWTKGTFLKNYLPHVLLIIFIVLGAMLSIMSPSGIAVSQFKESDFAEEITYQNMSFYVPQPGSTCGNSKLPCTIILFPGLALRGNSLDDGFYFK